MHGFPFTAAKQWGFFVIVIPPPPHLHLYYKTIHHVCAFGTLSILIRNV